MPSCATHLATSSASIATNCLKSFLVAHCKLRKACYGCNFAKPFRAAGVKAMAKGCTFLRRPCKAGKLLLPQLPRRPLAACTLISYRRESCIIRHVTISIQPCVCSSDGTARWGHGAGGWGKWGSVPPHRRSFRSNPVATFSKTVGRGVGTGSGVCSAAASGQQPGG